MAAKPVTLLIKPRGRRIPKLPSETTIYLQGSAHDLYERIAKQAAFSVHRLRITTADDGKLLPNDKGTTIDSAGLNDGSTIQVKDLGPQLGWRTVYIIEYIGPIIIHPLFYLLRRSIYANAPAEPSTLQTLSCVLITLHFLKRELETIFVHRFSNATMPFFNVFKNSAHYWLLSGLLIAYFTYAPSSPAAAATNVSPLAIYLPVALWLASELANLNAHLILRSLRSAGGTERGIPRGLGFDWVACPHYLFEVVGWVCVVAITRSWTTVLFVAVAGVQMALWAQKKERRYRKEMGGRYKKKRFAMIPGIV